MKLIYFYLFPLFPFPWCPFFVFYFYIFSRLATLGVFFFFKEKATGYVTRGLKDGPSRHPEKVYPGGEGHERGGRGEGRGQLRQRLYGGSTFTSSLQTFLAIYLSHQTSLPS